MQTRSKVVPVAGNKYQLGMLPPEVGSFIFMRMLGVSLRTAQSDEPTKATEPRAETPAQPKEESKINGEMRVRALAFAVFSNGITFDDFKFIQKQCMMVVSKLEERAGTEFPTPVMNSDGAWTPQGEELRDNPLTVSQLTTEVLVFCFADFFDGNGIGL